MRRRDITQTILRPLRKGVIVRGPNALVVILLLGILVSGPDAFARPAPDLRSETALDSEWISVGERLPDLSVLDLDGRKIRLSSFLGRVLLLNFTVSWCGGCEDQAPQLRHVFEEFHARGLEIVGISYDLNRSQTEAFRRKHSIPWPIEYTGKGFWKNRLGRMFQVDDTGAVLLINPQGVLEGDFRDLTALRGRLDELLARHPTN